MNLFVLLASTIVVLCGSSTTATDTNFYHDRTLQNDNRVKIFQEKNGIVVVEAESSDRRRSAEGSFWKAENNKTATIKGYAGTGYVRFNGNYTTNSTTPPPRNAALTYFINITNPGEYRLSIRSYKDNTNLKLYTNDCYIQMTNHPGVLGTSVKTYLPGSFSTWGYRTYVQFIENSTTASAETPYYTFPTEGVYRFVITGGSWSKYTFDRFMFYDNSIYKASVVESNDQRQSKFVFTKPPTNAWTKPSKPLSSLPLLPNFLKPKQNPEHFFDAGVANETDKYNGTVTIYGQSSIFNYDDYDITVLPEWKAQYGSFGKLFQTHRSGSSNFAYEFNGLYPPGTVTNITLGFAENFQPYCKSGRRLFDVTVNGKEFVSSLDVHDAVGCNMALLLSKAFQVNKNGKLIISFKSVNQDPMIAFIGIDSKEANTTLSVDSIDIPSDTPSNLASNVPSDISSDTPSFAPNDDAIIGKEDSVVSADVLSDTPSDTPSNLSSDTPSDAPSNLSSDTPSDAPSDVSSDVPSSISSNVQSDVPSDVRSDSPSDAPSDMPSAAPLPIVGLNLVEAESGAFIATVNDGDIIERSTIGVNTNLTIVVETLEDVVGNVRFGYDGIIVNEGVAPFAMSGKLNGEIKFWSTPYLSTNGLKTIKVNAYNLEYTKSIDEVAMTFTIV